MLERLGKRGRAGKSADEQLTELQSLVDKAREERAALSTMLSQVEVRGGKTSLPHVTKAVQKATEQATGATTKLDEVARRLTSLEGRTQGLEQIDGRIQGLLESVGQAEQSAQKLLAPDGELQKHRNAVQQLSSQALQTGASLEALKTEQVALDELRGALQRSQLELKGSADKAQSLTATFEQLRSGSSSLQQDNVKLKDAVRVAREDSSATQNTVREIEKKLGSFAELNELSKTTDERLVALNALTEHVTQKVKILENQKHTVEHAVVESNRLNEMVWNMEVQVTKLQDGGRQAVRTEETVERIEKLARDMAGQLETGMKAKDALTLDVARLERDRGTLSEFIQGYSDRLSVEKGEFDAFEQRIRGLHVAIGAVEQSVEAAAAGARHAATLHQRVEEVGTRLTGLTTQADELQQKQTELESLQSRLNQVEGLSKTTIWQHETLLKGQEDLERFRGEFDEFHKSFATAAALREQLNADRTALEGFLERTEEFSRFVPDLDATLNAITGKLSVVDEGTAKVTALEALMSELDRQMTQVVGYEEYVKRIESRLGLLDELSGAIDQRLEVQIGRRSEIEKVKNLCDGLSLQITDIQQKLDGVSAQQHKLVPITAKVTALNGQLTKVHTLFKETRKSEEEVREQERRLNELMTATRTVASDVEERLKQARGLTGELARSAAIKDELIEEISHVQYRQREVGGQVQATEDQLKRLEGVSAQLERRRSQLAFSEKKVSAFEERLGALRSMSDEVEGKIQAIATREAFIDSIKREVESVHAVSARSKAELEQVVAHRSAVAEAKVRADQVLASVNETEQRMGVIEARRKIVDEVQRKTSGIVNMLMDVRVNLETLSEQKSVIDHVVENLASLNSTVQGAQATLKALRAERELAERIEDGIKQLRARTGASTEDQRSA